VETIAVHDGVRPLVSKKLIIKLILKAEECSAVIPVVAPTDSFRSLDADGSHIIDRSQLRMVHTPQVFNAALLRKAYEQPFSTAFTDDASVVEAAGHRITLIDGEPSNIKITTPSDIVIAEALIARAEDETQF
jgi:2-C-methyl-D-erythritol 4-phosphate cytidylyltransferase